MEIRLEIINDSSNSYPTDEKLKCEICNGQNFYMTFGQREISVSKVDMIRVLRLLEMETE